MSICLRIILIIVSLCSLTFCASKIRRASLKSDSTIFWFALAMVIVLLSLFPNIAIYFSALIGVESPANFIFLVMIFLLFYKVFQQTLAISKLEEQIEKMAYAIAKQRIDMNDVYSNNTSNTDLD